MSSYKTIDGEGCNFLTIQKSKFIGHCKHVASVAEATKYIQEIKKKHADATHNCYAYVLESNSSMRKFSDDGEPAGTAGLPILDVIIKQNLTNIIVVVTRYFGGIKLGGGGLIRAYSQSAAQVIDSMEKCVNTFCAFYTMKMDYDIYNKILPKLQELQTIGTKFLENVQLSFVSTELDIATKLTNLCGGRCQISMDKNDYYNFKIEE